MLSVSCNPVDVHEAFRKFPDPCMRSIPEFPIDILGESASRSVCEFRKPLDLYLRDFCKVPDSRLRSLPQDFSFIYSEYPVRPSTIYL